ncbi:hypothetical protein KR074_009122, partial [Drosophila pseudoananassae]
EHQRALLDFCSMESIEWHFIPPRSPHFGGLWEAAVKTAKHHFYRAVASAVLGFEELRTLLCHIGAVINSRPLLSLSENPADLDVLTPAHFLTGGPSLSFIERDVTKLNFNRLDSWQRVSFLQQSFWSRWKEEYLSLLQQRSKWRASGPAMAPNDVVLVKDENLPPMKWPLERIMELIPGRDGIFRVAVIKTSSGVTKRAVTKLCLLPLKDESIEWHFIPPRSPHFGGLWEAAVKTAKHHFYRAVGSAVLGFEELRTLLCHIGAVINSRPLLSLSENPADLDVLTPAHFLTGGPSISFIEPNVTKLNFNRLDSWQRVSFLQQSFWSRWKEEYLSLLQQRSKWRASGPALAPNDVVLVKDENLPPMKWPLARIMELIPDSGSQVNFITEELSKILKLKRDRKDTNLLGIGQSAVSARHVVQATIHSRTQAFQLEAELIVLKSISSSQPERAVQVLDWNLPDNIKLADPLFHKPQRIDILLGADAFFELLKEGKFKQETYGPVLQNSVFGWIVSGRAPHFGGLWEAAVKSAKHLFLRAVGNALLKEDELQMVIVEVEAVLNSRPIIADGSSPNDGEAITPGHLLVGTSLATLPPASAQAKVEPNLSFLQRWHLVSAIKQRFWQDWSRDYLLSLQQRVKWNKESPNVIAGTVVAIQEDNLPPQTWLLGIITETIAGADGRVRVAIVKTKNGIYKRAIHRLAPLPIN